jgi:arylsulfatase A-like enzyme
MSLVEPESWDFYFPSAYVNVPSQIRANDKVAYPAEWKGHRYSSFSWGPIDVADNKMSDYQVVDWARYELNQKHEKPFYLACGIFRPHLPWQVPQKYFDLYPLEDIPDLLIENDDVKDAIMLNSRRYMHKFVLENKQWKHVIQAYLASIAFADAQIGRLLEALDNSSYKDNTIVVLWSDHGMHIGEKEVYEKFTLFEEATRVPFILRAPGVTKAGSRCSQPVSLLDVYPTLVDLTGFDVPKHCDGESVFPLVKDPEAKRDYSALISYHMPASSYIGHALRGERYRYIYYTGLNLEELYDHQTDPNEFDNLAYDPKYTEIVEKHRAELMQRVEGLSLEEIKKMPEGYVVKDGRIENANFISMDDMPLKMSK